VTMGTVSARLEELGLQLPRRVPPAPDHAAIVQSGNLVFVAGHGPLDHERRPIYKGRIGLDLTEADGYAAARQSALNVLATLDYELGGLDRVRRVVRLTGYVNAGPEFDRHPWVVNGASEVFDAVFHTTGQHARSTMGVTGLPLGMAVVIDTVFEAVEAGPEIRA
jgi:enamine deaminase RidA (YjgF/YER057c/UK114 family)